MSAASIAGSTGWSAQLMEEAHGIKDLHVVAPPACWPAAVSGCRVVGDGLRAPGTRTCVRLRPPSTDSLQPEPRPALRPPPVPRKIRTCRRRPHPAVRRLLPRAELRPPPVPSQHSTCRRKPHPLGALPLALPTWCCRRVWFEQVSLLVTGDDKWE